MPLGKRVGVLFFAPVMGISFDESEDPHHANIGHGGCRFFLLHVSVSSSSGAVPTRLAYVGGEHSYGAFLDLRGHSLCRYGVTSTGAFSVCWDLLGECRGSSVCESGDFFVSGWNLYRKWTSAKSSAYADRVKNHQPCRNA